MINFCKLSDTLAPMAYWGGSSGDHGFCTSVELTDDIEVEFADYIEKVFTLSSVLKYLKYIGQRCIGKLK